jgi:hypothetical protein
MHGPEMVDSADDTDDDPKKFARIDNLADDTADCQLS